MFAYVIQDMSYFITNECAPGFSSTGFRTVVWILIHYDALQRLMAVTRSGGSCIWVLVLLCWYGNDSGIAGRDGLNVCSFVMQNL